MHRAEWEPRNPTGRGIAVSGLGSHLLHHPRRERIGWAESEIRRGIALDLATILNAASWALSALWPNPRPHRRSIWGDLEPLLEENPVDGPRGP